MFDGAAKDELIQLLKQQISDLQSRLDSSEKKLTLLTTPQIYSRLYPEAPRPHVDVPVQPLKPSSPREFLKKTYVDPNRADVEASFAGK